MIIIKLYNIMKKKISKLIKFKQKIFNKINFKYYKIKYMI